VSGIFSLWFGFSRSVNRSVYLSHGVGLMALKYGVDSVFMYLGTPGKFLNPIEYLHPSLSYRLSSLVVNSTQPELEPAMSQWWVYASIIWAIPFIWIGLSMSARRARDAGWSLWFGLLFLLPLINLMVIIALSIAPSQQDRADTSVQDEEAAPDGSTFKSAFMAIVVAPLLGVALVSLSVFGAEAYGAAVFMGTPFLMGTICAYLVNRDGYRGWMPGVGAAVASVVICGGFFILLALEGLICLVTAAPVCLLLAVVGAVVGTAMAKATQSSAPSIGAMAVGLPILTLLQFGAPPESLPVHPVTTAIIIDAAPERVWPNVIGFSELPPPSDWLMKTGVAVPLRATIDGEGVGAVRYCEFTTGPFVEPITVWDPPRRLAFDVVEQPPSMEEWSPYQVVHAPHIAGHMVSRRGQFKLERLSNGRTKLIGTTWYTLDMAPDLYWSAWADWVVHGIHNRVLRHIKSLSEGEHLSRG